MIRIIGGKHRSRLIETPPSEIVLPTKNMVREALFSILGRKVSNAIVLDLFAGSGALGLEALSRGANKVYFSDHHREPIKIIGKNVESL
ncbi:MAG TPA: RsmD family RNA methyltransferase, partial [Bacilli bacterium]|nr:RsmD family RNA methyltransferase [Bacilli bacterium]